jgi:branched-chain amino acid transport system substrate-binding protein
MVKIKGRTTAFLGASLCMALLFGATCVTPATAQSLEKKVIKIGVAAALKQPFGQASVRGAEMAADEINKAGGVLGGKIELVQADTEATAPKATEAIERLYYRDKVDAIVGAYSSEEATAFQEESAKLHLIMLFHGTTHILDDKYKANPEQYKYYWNYITSDLQYTDYVRDHQLGVLVDALKKQLGLSKVNVGVLTDAALWTEVMDPGFQKAVKARPDTNLVYVGKISRDAVDFSNELTEIRGKKVQLMLCATGYSGAYSLIKQASELKVPALFAGMITLSWSTSNFIKAVGVDAASYTASLGVATMPTTPHTVKMLQEYAHRYGGGVPDMDVGPTYNGLKAYAKAVQMAGSLDKDKVAAALKQIHLPENEIWGAKEFQFDENHRAVVSPKDGMIIYSYQYQPGGKVELFDPPQFKRIDVTFPPYMQAVWKKK